MVVAVRVEPVERHDLEAGKAVAGGGGAAGDDKRPQMGQLPPDLPQRPEMRGRCQ